MYATLHASERAVEAARRLAQPDVAGLGALVDQVCAEAGTYAPDVARLAIAQADGDTARAVTLLRVWAATLPTLATTAVAPEDVRLGRRVSAAFAEIPGGQWLGAAPQMRSRLIEWPADEPPGAAAPDPAPVGGAGEEPPTRADRPRVADLLSDLPVFAPAPEADGPDPAETPLTLPASRGARLAALARGETGALTAFASLGHARQREEVLVEATAATAGVRIAHPRTGAAVRVADVPISQAEVITDALLDGRPGFVLGFGATLGRVERRAIAIAIVDGALQAGADGAFSEGALLAGVDGLATSGFVEHLCLPHYASFASYLARVGEPSDTEDGDE
ncbi:MAG TPA: carbon-phosphorus lyase complex subunit PhnI [Solirubrobacteraceae bacterium]|nr:carbon-phosphorus lyase complex subunit PhnI [Solirubrobacteraceae bacterium]